MGSSSVSSKWNTDRECPGRFFQLKIEGFCSTSDCDGIVRSRNGANQGAELSQIKDSCKTSKWSDDDNSKLQSPERCCGKWSSHQESKRKENLRREESGSVFCGKDMDNVEKETHVVSVMTSKPLETEDMVRGAKQTDGEQERIELRRDGHSKNVQTPNSGVDCYWWSAHPRGGRSVRSWLESIRNRAINRWDACSPIGRQALQWPRILLRVGQRSRATVDQRREEHYLQDRQVRTSCRSTVICQFWKQFVPYTATTGDRWEQKQTKPLETELHEVTNKPPGDWGRNPQKPKAKTRGMTRKIGRSVGRSSWLVGGVHR